MKRTIYSVLILLGIIVSSCSKNDTDRIYYDRKYKKEVIESNKALKDYYLGSQIPGVSVAVSVDGKLVYSQGYGTANKEQDSPVLRKTKFRIGTSSQIFTTMLAAKLQEEGKLNLDSSIYNYLPNYPKKQWDFTPRMLGAHTVTFPVEGESDFRNKNHLNTIKEFLHKYDQVELVKEPNTSLEHSSYGMVLLGGIIEAVGKNSYAKLMKNEICTPLNLEDTQLDSPYLLIKNRSNFYSTDFVARLVNAETVNLAPYGPSAGILSTAEDLNTIAQQLLAPGFLSEETIELLTTEHKLNDGEVLSNSFGWLVNKNLKEDQAVIGQIGDVYGGASMVVVFPKDKIVVSMCANKGNVMRELPVMKIANIFLDEK